MHEPPIFLVIPWTNMNVWIPTNINKCKKVTNKITFFSSFAYKKNLFQKYLYAYEKCVHNCMGVVSYMSIFIINIHVPSMMYVM